MDRIEKIFQQAEKIEAKDGEKAAEKFIKAEFKKIENELSFTEIGRFLDRFEKDVNTFHEEVKRIIEKEKKKNKNKK